MIQVRTSHTRVVLTSLLVVIAFLLIAQHNSARAAIQDCTPVPPVSLSDVELNWIRLQIPVPGVTTTCYESSSENPGSFKAVYYIQDVASYIAGLYKFIAGAIGIIATLMVFYAGLRWLTAGGNRSRVQDAKETLFSALAAVVLAFGSYLLLYTINPRLVNLRVPTLTPVIGISQQTGNTCVMQKVCFSGTAVGTSCENDADCPGAGAGACDFIVDLGDDAQQGQAVCGKSYVYKTLPDGQSIVTATSCVGSFCDGEQFGTEVCASEKQSSPTPQVGAECIAPRDRCNAITDDFASESACPAMSINVRDPINAPDQVLGAGKCRWMDASWVDLNEPDDRCTWYPALWCGEGYERVGCGECVTANVSCPDVDEITYEGEFAGITGESPAKCVSTEGEAVYAADQTGDGQNLKGICCHKVGLPMTAENLKCVSNSNPPPNL